MGGEEASELYFGVVTAHAMPPLQQPVVGGHQHCVVRDRRRSDETIRGIGVKALKLAGKNGYFAGERQFDGAFT
jgi:hypothetical protein